MFGRVPAATDEDFIIWRSAQTSRKTKDLIKRETINAELLALKMIFNRLVESKILRESPARSIKQLKLNDRSFYVISDEEEKLYLLKNQAYV